MDKIQQYLNDNNYYNIYANSELFEEYIQTLSCNDVFQIAITLNKLLRNKSDEEVIADNMIAGELVAPTSDIRNIIVENLLNILKKMKDNRLRAELVYYTFINLHMFSDGNGRTARLMYGLLDGNLESKEWYIHSDDSTHEYSGNFCTYKKMLDEREINQNANDMLSKVVEVYADKYPLLEDKEIYRTYSSGMHGISVPIDKIIPENIRNRLTSDEKLKISIILGDNENYYSIAGLTMLIITSENGQLNEWIKRDNENIEKCFQKGTNEDWIRYRLCFSLIKNNDLLEKWSIEDWKKVIQIGNQLKVMQFNNLNEIYFNKDCKEKCKRN